MEVCCECIVLFQTSEYAVEELIWNKCQTFYVLPSYWFLSARKLKCCGRFKNCFKVWENSWPLALLPELTKSERFKLTWGRAARLLWLKLLALVQ
jgi:hypothetical protein